MLTIERESSGGPTPLYREVNPSVLKMCRRSDSGDSLILEEATCVCIRVFTKSNGKPSRVPNTPAANPPIASSPRWNDRG